MSGFGDDIKEDQLHQLGTQMTYLLAGYEQSDGPEKSLKEILSTNYLMSLQSYGCGQLYAKPVSISSQSFPNENVYNYDKFRMVLGRVKPEKKPNYHYNFCNPKASNYPIGINNGNIGSVALAVTSDRYAIFGIVTDYLPDSGNAGKGSKPVITLLYDNPYFIEILIKSQLYYSHPSKFNLVIPQPKDLK